jgi:hypothetical protein
MAPITQCTCLAHGRYYTRRDAEDCIKYLSGTKLDDRIVRADWDAGFQEGRQYGRGKSGGQACGWETHQATIGPTQSDCSWNCGWVFRHVRLVWTSKKAFLSCMAGQFWIAVPSWCVCNVMAGF